MERQPDRRLQFQMGTSSEPLSRLAIVGVEMWEFERLGNETKVPCFFELNAKSIMTKPLQWFISFFLNRAIARHLSGIKHAAKES